MKKQVSALVLILILAGGVLAGAPFPSGEHEGSMPAMMDCCRLAQMHSQTPEVATAKLCCAINCTQPAPTQSAGAIRVTFPALVPAHPALVPRSLPGPSWYASSTEPQSESPPPFYLLNLALLI